MTAEKKEIGDGPSPARRLDRWLKLLLLFFGFGLLLYLGKSILVPLFYALLFALAIHPLGNWLEKRGVNRVLASIFAVTCAFLILLSIALLLFFQVEGFVQDLPDIKARIKQLGESTIARLPNWFTSGIKSNLLNENNISNWSGSLGSTLGEILATGTAFFSFCALLPVYTTLILIYRNRFVLFFQYVFPKGKRSEAFSIVLKSSTTIRSYAKGMFLVTLIIAVLNTIALLLLGIKYAFFFGILSGMLTLIPYFGVAVGSAIPVVIALVTKDSIWYPIGVFACFSFVQFLEGNFITPNIVGNQVNLNPLMAIIALVVGGMFWGIYGVVIGIPLLALFNVFCAEITYLKPISILLSSGRIKEKEKAD